MRSYLFCTGIQCLAIASALTSALPAAASKVTIGGSSVLSLGSSRLEIECGDLLVEGILNAGDNGFVARDVWIAPGGLTEGGSALLEVRGDWNAAGTFLSQSSTVEFADGCERAEASITGGTTFHDLALTSGSGKLYRLGTLLPTTVEGMFEISGSSNEPVSLRSTATGLAAVLHLEGSGTGALADVDDVDASSGNVIPLWTSTLGSNAAGWELIQPSIPMLSPLGFAILLLGLAWSGIQTLSGRQ